MCPASPAGARRVGRTSRSEPGVLPVGEAIVILKENFASRIVLTRNWPAVSLRARIIRSLEPATQGD